MLNARKLSGTGMAAAACWAALSMFLMAVDVAQGQSNSLQSLINGFAGPFSASPAGLSPTIGSSAPASNIPAAAPSPSDGTNEYCCSLLRGINFETNLPVVIADTGGKTVNRDDQESRVCTCSTGLEKGDVNMTAVFRVRGGTNSQLRNKIFQYAIDIDDKKWFLGMPKSKKWMLYGQQLDPFGLHNWFGFELGRLTGEYAIRTKHCELFIIDDNTPLSKEKHYRGLYVAMEKPRQETNRINIADNSNPADITGGYMAEFKHAQNPDNLPTINGSRSNQQWNVEYPKDKNITQAQLQYFNTYLNRFETALYDQTNWRDYAEESNWINWFLAIELIRNVKHSYHSSSWMYKDADNTPRSKLHMGPLWGNSYNTSELGATAPNPASGGNGVSASGWLFRVCLNNYCPQLDVYAPGYGISVWFQQLWKDPEWVQAVADRYQVLRAGNWSDATITNTLTNLQTLVGPAALRTLDRWEAELYQPAYFNSKQAMIDFTFSNLRQWTLDRLRWLDGAFRTAVDPPRAQGPYPSSFSPTPPVSTAG